MKHSDIIKTAIIAFSGVIFFISFVTGESIDDNLFRWISGVTAFLIIIWFVYDKWIWKLFPFNKIAHYYFDIPAIHGTWKGTLMYDADENGKSGSVDLYVSIDQNLTSLQIRSYFEKPSESYSIAYKIEKSNQNRLQLYYIYKSEAPYGKRETNRPHDGCVVLNIIGEPVEELSGSYFTERKGTGRITLNKHSKRTSETLEQAKSLFSSDKARD